MLERDVVEERQKSTTSVSYLAASEVATENASSVSLCEVLRLCG